MKDYAEEPKMGPTENKQPTTIRIKHADLPGIEEAAPGDRVHLVLHGHIHANRSKDKFSDGEAEVDVHSIEHGEKPEKKKNASTMRMDDLKKKVVDMSEKDENMEGHQETKIKEDGEE
jgi:hypothetical protein